MLFQDAIDGRGWLGIQPSQPHGYSVDEAAARAGPIPNDSGQLSRFGMIHLVAMNVKRWATWLNTWFRLK